MSGYTDEAIVHHGVLDGVAEFIGKPFTPQELAHKIRGVLEASSSGDVRRQPAS
jgi:DNA-binding response OmpR family regulator